MTTEFTTAAEIATEPDSEQVTVDTEVLGTATVSLPSQWDVGPAYQDDDRAICTLYGNTNTRIDVKAFTTIYSDDSEPTAVLLKLYHSEKPYSPPQCKETTVVDTIPDFETAVERLTAV